ncbi:MAG: PspC domain-containing protein [Anaerolineae bacterium]
MQKRLYRSEDNEMVAGVAAGLADYFDVDVTLIRLAFVLFTLLGGPGLLVYIAMWFVVPEQSEVDGKLKNDAFDL